MNPACLTNGYNADGMAIKAAIKKIKEGHPINCVWMSLFFISPTTNHNSGCANVSPCTKNNHL